MFNPNEATTRKELIDPALLKAGWDVHNANQVGLEIPVDQSDPQAWALLKTKLDRVKESGGTYNVQLPSGISDYVLYRANGDILAIVEAKRTSTDPRLAQAQAEFYVEEIEKHQSFRPFAFMTNGKEIYFLDVHAASKRPVAGFFSAEDLENLLYIRQNKQPLSSTPIDTTIVNRSYQLEAVRSVGKAFEQDNKRKALLVMATGTGKTRTVMALIDLFIRTHQAQRILFVADRDELVKQAIDDGFSKFIPNEPCERIYSKKSTYNTSRLYAVTIQTLNLYFQSFTPGFFDLIVFDEAHRSLYNKWNEPLQYFDARIIGLTATPADFIDRNTYLMFDCDNSEPTYLYPYEQAVKEGYLVDYNLYTAQTKFQRKGIKGVDLSEEERNTLYEQGIDPDELDFNGSDLERRVSNKDTLRRQWEEIWNQCYKDESGQLPGKTIIFAMTQQHALHLEETFNEMYPQYPDMTRVITSKSNHRGMLIDHFKKEDDPRIAITVDLLETGVDIPEVVNLIFMKPVQSRIKLGQMIGRGTRSQAACHFLHRLPNHEKKNFRILDFWENDFNKSASEELKQSLPVLVSLFNTRLSLLEQYVQSGKFPTEQRNIIDCLREQIAQIPTESFSVKKHLDDIEEVKQDSFWLYLTATKINFLKLKIAPLLRYAASVDVEATTFTHKVERLKLQNLTEKGSAALIDSIRDDVSRLPNFVFENPAYRPIADLCLAPQRLQATDAQTLDQVIDLLAPQMNNKRDKVNPFLSLDLSDRVAMSGYIFLRGGTERIYIEEYRQRIENKLAELIDNDPIIPAIEQGAEISDQQFIALERTLHHVLGEQELELTPENVRIAYGWKVGSLIEFLGKILDLAGIPDYNDIIRRQFAEFIKSHTYNPGQLRFLELVRDVFVQRRHLNQADFYEQPFINLGADAVERLFTPEQRQEIIAFTRTLTA